MMNGEWLVAQQPLEMLKSNLAIDGALDETVVGVLYSRKMKLAMVSRLMVDDKTTKLARGSLEVLVRKMQNEKMVFERK